MQALHADRVLGLALVELHEQDGFRLALEHGRQGRAEHGDVAGQLQHGAVDQLYGDGLESDQVLG